MKYYLFFAYFLIYDTLSYGQTNSAIRTYQATNTQFVDNSFESNQYELQVLKSCLKSHDFAQKSMLKAPILFHNVLKNGESSSVERQKILAQLAVLNNAFGGDYDEKFLDCKIRFCQSTQEGGIIDIIAADTLSINGLMALSKTWLTREEAKKCIHIFILDFGNNTAGYVPMMDTIMGRDCIFLNRKFLAYNPTTNYDIGKTLVHLMGNYLGLKPIWGTGPCEDDGIMDTPRHHGPNTRCFTGRRLSSCNSTSYQLNNNFMDALPDDCSNSFTLHQAIRMYENLNTSGMRHYLISGNMMCNE